MKLLKVLIAQKERVINSMPIMIKQLNILIKNNILMKM